jgi:hypothetical protein
MVHDWSKPVDGHPRLFDHSALELLTTAHPRVVVSVYSLLAVALLWSGVDAGLSASVVVRRAAAGIAVWTLTEYLMHRYAFHFVPRTRTGVALAYLSHGVHHAYPRDPDRLVMPLIVSAPIAVMLLLTGRAIGGAGPLPASLRGDGSTVRRVDSHLGLRVPHGPLRRIRTGDGRCPLVRRSHDAIEERDVAVAQERQQ